MDMNVNLVEQLLLMEKGSGFLLVKEIDWLLKVQRLTSKWKRSLIRCFIV